MKWKTPERRPYYAKYEPVKVENHKGWFECYRLPGDVFAICEPQHLQEVNAFLILGAERALLLDTGMGVCDIKPLVDELMDKARGEGLARSGELLVANCHFHFDHTGCNWRFDEVIVSDDPLAARQAKTGIDGYPLQDQADEDMFLFGYPEGFDPESYRIRPYRIRVARDGELFDLGGREVEFVYAPGHSEDHAMLYDHAHDILFAGDMIYFGAIYLQFDNEILGKSDIDDYIASLEKIAGKFPQAKRIYASHNDFIMEPALIGVIHDALVDVRAKAVPGEPLANPQYGYFGDPEVLMQYHFDGFSVITRP